MRSFEFLRSQCAPRVKHFINWVRKWLAPIADPVWAWRGIVSFPRFFAEWQRYTSLSGAEPIRFLDVRPQLHDRTKAQGFDAHYFYTNGWAMRRIVAAAPRYHIDIASQSIFANLLGGVLPVTYVDYRPLFARLTSFQCLGGSLLRLPFASCSVESLSCLHVIEHIGLGRYGDPLDPEGTVKAARELARVLAPHGNLFLALPVGRPRVCFNAHRIYAPHAVCNMFAGLGLVEFSGIHDDGRFVEHAHLSDFQDSEYACGLYWFRKADE